MFCVVSSLFRIVHFPHQGKIVIVDKLDFFSSDSSTGNVPYLGKTKITYENARAGLFKDSTLMGNFSLPPLTNVSMVNMIDNFRETMPLSAIEQAFKAGCMASTTAYEINEQLSITLDSYFPPSWLGSSDLDDPLNETFLIEESIVEVMYLEETPWNDIHHRSSFLTSLGVIPTCLDPLASPTMNAPF